MNLLYIYIFYIVKTKRSLYYKQYKEENVDKIKEKSKEYYKQNADKIKNQKKEYRQQNADKIREKSKEKRQLKKQVKYQQLTEQI